MKQLTEMPTRRQFCEILRDARNWKFPGTWSGSAYRDHPCGIKRGTIKLTDEWRADDSCSVQITDGTGWSDDYSNDSWGHGNPNPKPIGGRAILAWDGKWKEGFQEVLEPLVLGILNEVIAFCEVKLAAKEEAQRLAREEAAAEYEQACQRALKTVQEEAA